MGRDGLPPHPLPAPRSDGAHHLLAGEVIEIARLLGAVERDPAQAVVVVIAIAQLSETAESVHISAAVLLAVS